jgi:hypothetical protein
VRREATTVLLLNGQEMLVTEHYEDAFRYSNKKHGHIRYVYDPVRDVAVAPIPTKVSGPTQVLPFRYDAPTAKFRK